MAEAGKAEEFPNFTHIYFEPPEGKGDTVTVYALLDGPSITGAYKFVMQRGKGVVMDVECALFLRKDVARLGVAPLTSMYWFSETMKGTAVDWRPEVHDSDGLAIWNAPASISGARSTTRRRPGLRHSPTTTRAASACCSATACSTTTRTA